MDCSAPRRLRLTGAPLVGAPLGAPRHPMGPRRSPSSEPLLIGAPSHRGPFLCRSLSPGHPMGPSRSAQPRPRPPDGVEGLSTPPSAPSAPLLIAVCGALRDQHGPKINKVQRSGLRTLRCSDTVCGALCGGSADCDRCAMLGPRLPVHISTVPVREASGAWLSHCIRPPLNYIRPP